MLDTYTIHITPLPKPRMTQRDKWKQRPCVVRYRAYADELRLKARNFTYPESGWHTTFYLPMPKSWSKKKKVEHEGEPHRVKPDKSNLLKAVEDILLPNGDQQVWDGRYSKRWSMNPRIEFVLIDKHS